MESRWKQSGKTRVQLGGELFENDGKTMENEMESYTTYLFWGELCPVLGRIKKDRWISISFFSFSPFNCCLSAVL